MSNLSKLRTKFMNNFQTLVIRFWKQVEYCIGLCGHAGQTLERIVRRELLLECVETHRREGAGNEVVDVSLRLDDDFLHRLTEHPDGEASVGLEVKEDILVEGPDLFLVLLCDVPLLVEDRIDLRFSSTKLLRLFVQIFLEGVSNVLLLRLSVFRDLFDCFAVNGRDRHRSPEPQVHRRDQLRELSGRHLYADDVPSKTAVVAVFVMVANQLPLRQMHFDISIMLIEM